MSRHVYDVVFITDPRLQGGGNKSIAEEARVLASRGWSVGILPLLAPIDIAARPADRSLMDLFDAGIAMMLRPDEPIDCQLLIARGPAVFTAEQPIRPDVRADRALLVLNAVHVDATSTAMAFDPAALQTAATELFGFSFEFYPLSEVVADRVRMVAPQVPLADMSWGNIVDIDRWWRPRPPRVREPLRMGRHSRDNPMKWPDTAEQIMQIYPDTPDIELRALGGLRTLEKLLPAIPKNWHLYKFDGHDVASFLHELDIYVYYHNSRWIEAFGRAPLEALASGVTVVLPPYLEAVFGEAGLYAEPQDALALTRRVAADDEFRNTHLAQAVEITNDRFGPESFKRKINGLIGPPRTATVPGARISQDVVEAASAAEAERDNGEGASALKADRGDASSPAAAASASTVVEQVAQAPAEVQAPSAPDGAAAPEASAAAEIRAGAGESAVRKPVVLFFTDNGVGLGHVTRLQAIARRLGDDVQPMFLTMSESHSVVSEAGFPVEYFPSARKLGFEKKLWAPMLERRLRRLINRVQPAVLVVDHVSPSHAFASIKNTFPNLTMVWSRRGLWQRGRNRPAIKIAEAFDVVLEPSDVAAALDIGATVGAGQARTVRPITLISREELVDREAAREFLGLGEGKAALVQLADDDPNRLHEMIAHVRDHLHSLGVTEIFAPLHVLHAGNLRPVDGVTMRPIYPASRYLNAFDLAVSACGYNSYHELVMASIPTVFVAKDHKGLDDQPRRASFAEIGGIGWWSTSIHDPQFRGQLAQALRPERAARARAAARAIYPGNGAVDAAEAVRTMALSKSTVGAAGGDA